VHDTSNLKLIGVCGRAGAGKDSFYEHVLRPRGFLRWRMTLHYKVWLVATGRFTWEEVFETKPKPCRKAQQEEMTALRQVWGEETWLNTFKTWMRALTEIVGIHPAGIAVTDMRFLAEIRGVKAMGGKILHLQAPDEQANLDPELRGHRSEVELDSPEVVDLRDAYLFNTKESFAFLREGGEEVLRRWGWL
jgi:hypothetical protein